MQILLIDHVQRLSFFYQLYEMLLCLNKSCEDSTITFPLNIAIIMNLNGRTKNKYISFVFKSVAEGGSGAGTFQSNVASDCKELIMNKVSDF